MRAAVLDAPSPPRKRGVIVRPGSVRQARFEAGLSLAGVAGTDITRAAIHLIETGRARPSMATLRLIADRTRKPMTYFLEQSALVEGSRPTGDPQLEAIEHLIDARAYSEALSAARTLLLSVNDASDRARLNLWMGIAHNKLRSLPEALACVREARSVFEACGDPWMVVECIDWEAFTLHLTQHPRALELALEALASCRQLDPIPTRTEVRILSHIGAIHHQQHHWDAAIRFLEAALEASSVLKDLPSMAAINHDLMMAFGYLGNYPEALSRGQKARHLYGVLRDRVSIAAIENDIGDLKLLHGDIAGAYGHIAASLGHFEEAGVEARKSHVLLTMANLHMVRGSDYEAELWSRDALELAERLDEQRNVALARQYLGQIAAGRGDLLLADNEFQAAIAILEANEAPQRLIECRLAYADALEGSGDLHGANRQLRAALVGHSRHPAALRIASA